MNTNRYKSQGYHPIIELQKSEVPMVKTVQTDTMTDMANECFDLPFDGHCTFYPYRMPELPTDYKILVITGRSGSGKSTLLKHFGRLYDIPQYRPDEYIPMAFLHSGISVEDYNTRVKSVGLNPLEVSYKTYNQLSEGEKFRADVALQLCDTATFDEFTSKVDRNVAKVVCTGIRKCVDEHQLHGIVLCSCHKDFIPWVQPDYIIDLDDSTVYARGVSNDTDEKKIEEELIGSITI